MRVPCVVCESPYVLRVPVCCNMNYELGQSEIYGVNSNRLFQTMRSDDFITSSGLNKIISEQTQTSNVVDDQQFAIYRFQLSIYTSLDLKRVATLDDNNYKFSNFRTIN